MTLNCLLLLLDSSFVKHPYDKGKTPPKAMENVHGFRIFFQPMASLTRSAGSVQLAPIYPQVEGCFAVDGAAVIDQGAPSRFSLLNCCSPSQVCADNTYNF